jgi:hypothetical protein
MPLDKQAVLDEAAILLPNGNVLTDTQMSSILDRIVSRFDLDDESKFAEALCRFLDAVADVNNGKASVDSSALASEKIGDYSRSYNTSGIKDVWKNFKKELRTTCPVVYGYSFPVVVGMRIKSGESLDVLNCPNINDSYL